MEKKLFYGQLVAMVLLTCLVICLTPLPFAFAVLCTVISSAFILADEFWLVEKAGTAAKSAVVACILVLNMTFLLLLRCMIEVLA